MRYWIFVNNSVQGPYTIKEIVERNFISPNLLVCPSEMSATTPSSWYFAKELSEFDPYISDRVKVAVEDFEFDLNQFSFENCNKDVDDEIDIEEIIENEKKKMNKKEEEEYKKKIKVFEKNITELDEKLKKAFNVIEKYEENLKEKERVIEKLEKEIKELKKSKEEEKRVLEEKLKRYEEELLNKTNDFMQETEKGLTVSKPKDENICIKSDFSLVSKDDNITIAPSMKENTSEVSFEGVNNVLPDTLALANKTEERIIGEEKNISLARIENIDENINESLQSQGLPINLSTFKKVDVEQMNEDNFLVADEQINVVENSDFKAKPLASVANSIENSLDSQENIDKTLDTDKGLLDTNNIEIAVSTFASTSHINSGAPFQVTDVNLETVETNLDVVSGLKIEPVSTNTVNLHESTIEKQQDIEFKNENEKKENILKEDFYFDVKSEEPKHEQPKNDKEDLTTQDYRIIRTFEITKDRSSNVVSSNELEGVNESNSSPLHQSREKTEISEDVIKVEDKRNDIKQQSEIKKGVISERKKRSSKLIAIASVGVIVFFFALVYILRSGGDIANVGSNIVKREYNKPLQNQKAEDLKTETAQTQNKQENENLKISKINENVKKAIDVVKGYNLGEGKGTIERWLSNTVASSVKGKEEWNATYLSGNIFVVQYRFLRFKSEPIVYLFEVDVEKDEIVRGINNNAINLLAGNKLSNKEGLSKISKKVSKQLESDEEMF